MRCPDDLIKIIQNAAIQPKPIVAELLYTWDWRRFITPNLSGKLLKNHSFYHSFLIKKEKKISVFRAKKYPQNEEWIPEGGIKLLKDNVEFTSVEASDFRVDTLHLDKVFSDLYTKYFPTLELKDRKEAEASWERLRTVLENLPKRRKNLAPMRILSFPKQIAATPTSLPHYLEPFMNEAVPELCGEKCIVEPTDSQFQTEIKSGMDIAVYTASKKDRPWLGRVLTVMEDGLSFEVQWFKRRNKGLTFHALHNKDGSKYTQMLDTDTVMLWEFTDNKTVDSFEVSQEYLDKIREEYSSHDMCYE